MGIHGDEVRLGCGPGFSESATLSWLRRRGAVEGPVESTHVDVYLDTRSDELAAAGLAARCRRAAGLRTIDVAAVPIEPEIALARAEHTRALVGHEDPGDAVRRLVAHAFGLQLSEIPREVVTLETTRRRFAVAVPQARLELSVDDVQATEPHGRRASFGELALQLRDGAIAALGELGRDLARRGGLALAEQTRLEHARELLGLAGFRYGVKPPALSGEQALGEAARAVVAAFWATARAHVPGVRVGLDPEHVHKMRVAMRRMRTALRVFEDVFDPELAEAVRDEVRRVGRLLGEVRDLDVQRLAIGSWSALFHEIEGAAWQEIDERLARRRTHARKVVLAELDSASWRALDRSVAQCLGEHVAAGRDTVAVRAPAIVIRRVERCEKALARLHEEGTARRAHELRIAVKNLRYTLELIGGALDWELGDVVSMLSELQDELGALQDGVQTGRLAAELFELPPRPSSGSAYALGALLGHGRALESAALAVANAALGRHELERTLVQLRELVHGA